MKIFDGSWKTTSAGILSIVGGLVRLGFAIKAKELSEEAIMTIATTILTGVGLLFARDNNKTSEQVGLPVKPMADPTKTP